MVRRGFTLVELTVVLAVMLILGAITTVSYQAFVGMQRDSRATISIMSAVLAERNAAANAGGFISDPAVLRAVMGGADVVDAMTASTSDSQVSVRVGSGGLWVVAQGNNCQYTYVSPVDQNMVSTSGQLSGGECRADNSELPLGAGGN